MTKTRKTETGTAVSKLVGEFLMNQRIKSDMTRGYVAKQMGVSEPQIQKYESGTNELSMSRLYAISSVLGFKPASLFEYIESGSAPYPHVFHPNTLKDPELRKGATAIFNAIRRIDSENQ